MIGRNCRIGKGAWLVGSYLGDNVTIGEGVHVCHALLCAGATVLANAVIRPGVVISYGVRSIPKLQALGTKELAALHKTLCKQLAWIVRQEELCHRFVLQQICADFNYIWASSLWWTNLPKTSFASKGSLSWNAGCHWARKGCC